MLTRSASNRIKQFGLSTLHDHWFTSLFAGEPHFEDGVLAYFDGRVVCICGFPLQSSQPIARSLILHLAGKWVCERGAESIVFIGPAAKGLNKLKKLGLRVVNEQRPSKIASELSIDCTNGPGSVFHRRIYRRSRALDFIVSIRTGGVASAEHFQLIETFYRSREVTGYLAEIAFALPAVLRSPRVRLVEARKDGRLCGFIAMHKPFANQVVGLFMACRQDMPGVCDFLYGAMLDEARRLGASRINLGPSPSKGHFDFKRKWGGEPLVPPYYFVQWARGVLALRFHTAWGPRLLRL